MSREQLSGIDQKVTQRVSDGSAPSSESHREHRRFRRARKVRAAVRNHPPLDLTWRAVVLVAGVLIIVTGVILIPLPGPGWLIVFVGLGVLATEFDWAQRILHRARDKMHAARERARDPKARRRMIALTVVLVLAAGGAAWWWLETFGLPVPDWLLR